MPKKSLARNKVNYATQQFLDIAEVKDDCVVMRDGTLRGVIMVSSINFALKSEDEQNAIIASYVSFLNNIDFPIQIVIQSRELNIEDYIDSLKKKEKEQTNELLKMQTSEYINYVNELIAMSKIMNKRFYVVVPYDPLSDKHKNFFASFLDVFKPAVLLKVKDDKFQKRRSDLMKRMENIIAGLSSMSLNTAILDTQSLIELYYNTYNPVTSANQKLADVNQLRIGL
jgi:hypothetical protein